MKRLDFDTLVKCINWSKQDFYVGEMTKSILNGSADKFLMIPDGDYEDAMQSLKARREEEERLSSTVGRNNEGIELEKEGRTDEAISLYEQNVADGYPATHSFERLMKIYRKRKDYKSEERVIRRAIEVFSSENARRAELSIERVPSKADEIRIALNSCSKVMGDDGLYCFVPYDVAAYVVRLDKTLALMGELNE